jgi:hypothetical protein
MLEDLCLAVAKVVNGGRSAFHVRISGFTLPVGHAYPHRVALILLYPNALFHTRPAARLSRGHPAALSLTSEVVKSCTRRYVSTAKRNTYHPGEMGACTHGSDLICVYIYPEGALPDTEYPSEFHSTFHSCDHSLGGVHRAAPPL